MYLNICVHLWFVSNYSLLYKNILQLFFLFIATFVFYFHSQYWKMYFNVFLLYIYNLTEHILRLRNYFKNYFGIMFSLNVSVPFLFIPLLIIFFITNVFSLLTNVLCTFIFLFLCTINFPGTFLPKCGKLPRFELYFLLN